MLKIVLLWLRGLICYLDKRILTVWKEMLVGDILLMQLEIPLSTVEYAARKAYEKGVKVVLNPAPACSLPESLFQYLYMITPNRIEAEMLTGVKINSKEDVAMAAGVLYRKGVEKYNNNFG